MFVITVSVCYVIIGYGLEKNEEMLVDYERMKIHKGMNTITKSSNF